MRFKFASFIAAGLAVLIATAALAATWPIERMRAETVQIKGIGSGVVISDWQILTARHVAGTTLGAALTVIFPDGQERVGKVVWASPDLDVAIIGVAVPEGSPAAVLDCRAPRVGDEVAIVGFPFPDKWNVRYAYTFGRVASVEPNPAFPYSWAVFMDANIFPGNSGGPVFATTGKVMGIAVAGIGMQGGSGLSVMVPSARLCPQIGVQ